MSLSTAHLNNTLILASHVFLWSDREMLWLGFYHGDERNNHMMIFTSFSKLLLKRTPFTLFNVSPCQKFYIKV